MNFYADVILVAVIAVLWPVWENAIAWPRFLRELAAGDPPVVRQRGYRQTVAIQWTLCAITVLVWLVQGRALASLPLYSPVPWRVWLGAAIAIAVVVLMALQVRTVRANADARATLRRQIGSLAPILPQSLAELAWFRVVSVTAGVCEEWLFRGVLTTVLAGWFGLPVAVGLSSVAFGFAHAYQGPAGIVKTGLVGLVMSGIVLATGSLVPAMIVHAAIDLGSGAATYIALTTRDEPPAAAGASA